MAVREPTPTRHLWFRRRVPRRPSGQLVGGQWNKSSSYEQDRLKSYHLLWHASERSLNPETMIGLNSERKVCKWYPQTWDCNKNVTNAPHKMWFPPATVITFHYLRTPWATQMRTNEVLRAESSQNFPAGGGVLQFLLVGNAVLFVETKDADPTGPSISCWFYMGFTASGCVIITPTDNSNKRASRDELWPTPSRQPLEHLYPPLNPHGFCPVLLLLDL